MTVRRVGIACPKHGYFQHPSCPICESHKAACAEINAPNINTESWVPGWYEHIDSKPIYIESKKHLIHECEKRGSFARAFVKPKSQGAGYEHKKH